ncbi:hypothetical protein AYL99_11675 [Fonsecaea erecta]|uniref:Uncharacterized protein n=1 Tax=Fonsecaea erecta TaxID=1367422 RepID=A0A178Z2Z6_9EURO|nr:hypothetical protein AYL99_11675 [Fonsecaea erecta]OAP54140.1 hypothetical protein AYL99_11675 [Fonsecaea erecta]
MCQYGKVILTEVHCLRAIPEKHRTEKRLVKRCPKSPKPGLACYQMSHDPALDQLPSWEFGSCQYCEDSTAKVDTIKIKLVDLAN